jgi:hypothetical protein
MAHVLADMKQEWKLFKHDEPGHRFTHHRERMQHRSKVINAIGLMLGIALVAGGVLFCFLPGPGSVLIVFGFALVSARWARMARLMDRTEPKLRHFFHRQQRRWHEMSGKAKLSVMLGLAAVAVAACLFMWRFVVSAYLLG